MRPRDARERSARRSGPLPAELIELGRIVNRHGIRGEVRVLPHNPESAVLCEAAPVAVTGADGGPEWHRVLGARRHKQFVLLRLAGIDTANAAEALIGRGIAVPRERLPPAGDGVYHVDLIGCAVRTTAGEPLGTVKEMIVTGSNDVCVVHGPRGEVLIPLVADVIAALDVAARTIVVRPLPGLLDG